MQPQAIFIPLCVQVILTMFVFFFMYYERIAEMRRKRVKTQDLANPEFAENALKDSANSSEHFENLFEVPNLFFIAVLTIYVLNHADHLFVIMAWAFVVLRVIHTLVSLTYNRIIHRFSAYFISTLILWAMWFRILFIVLQMNSTPQ